RSGNLRVDLLEVQRVPDVRPEVHAGNGVLEVSGAMTQNALDRLDDLARVDTVLGSDLLGLTRRDARSDEWLVRALADTHQLVGREIVIEVATVREQNLPLEMSKPYKRVSEIQFQRLDLVAILRDLGVRALEDVRRVVGHHVVQTVEIVLAL